MFIPSAHGDSHEVLGSTATIKLSAADTGGQLAVVEHSAPRDTGPPPHMHLEADELLYILDGTFMVSLGDVGASRPAGPGTWIHVARGTVHTYRCSSDAGRVLSVYTPGGGEAFFREIGGIDQTDADAVRALAAAHGMTLPRSRDPHN